MTVQLIAPCDSILDADSKKPNIKRLFFSVFEETWI